MTSRTKIPDGWRLVRLGDVAEVVGGSTPSRKQPSFWDGAIPWVVPSELTELQGRYLTFTKENITDAGLKAAGLRVLPAESVLLTSRATIGTTAINTLPITTNQGFQNLIPNPSAESLWLYYHSTRHNAREMHKELHRHGGATTRPGSFTRNAVRSLPILLPPLPEQRAIAEVLDSIDEAIEATEAVVAATEQTARRPAPPPPDPRRPRLAFRVERSPRHRHNPRRLGGSAVGGGVS